MPINTLGHPAPGSVPASPCQPQNPIHAKPSPGPGHTFGGAQNPSHETSAFPKQWDAPWCRGHHPRRVASSQVAGPSPGHRGAPSSAPFQRDPAPKHAAGAHPRGPDSYKGMQALHSLTPILFSVEAGAFGRPWRPAGRIESPFLCFSKNLLGAASQGAERPVSPWCCRGDAAGVQGTESGPTAPCGACTLGWTGGSSALLRAGSAAAKEQIN